MLPLYSIINFTFYLKSAGEQCVHNKVTLNDIVVGHIFSEGIWITNSFFNIKFKASAFFINYI